MNELIDKRPNFARQDPNYKPNDDYYTPEWIFNALGLTFDIDVCAPAGGVPWIPAIKSYSLAEDGLMQNWNGLVWCNPPYSKPAPWIDKFISHSNGIMLTQVARSLGFLKLWNNVDGIVFPEHKLMKFQHMTAGTKGIFMPVALFAMGKVAVNAIAKIGQVR